MFTVGKYLYTFSAGGFNKVDTTKPQSQSKLNVIKGKMTDTDLAFVIDALSQKIDQIDGLIRCLTEQQYEFNKKLKQIDVLINSGNGVLIDENSSKLEHLNSLTQLAEKTIVEADKLAESIRREIEEKAQSQAAHILLKAEEKAKKESDKIINDAKSNARLAASQEAENILGSINEIKNIFDKAYQNVLSNFSDSTE